MWKYQWNLKHINVTGVIMVCCPLVTVMSDSLPPHGLQPAMLLCPWDFHKNTGVGCHFLLQGIFPIPGIKPVSPELADRFFTTEPPGKPNGYLVKLDCIFQDTIKSDSDTISSRNYKCDVLLGWEKWSIQIIHKSTCGPGKNRSIFPRKKFSFPWKPQSTKGGQWPQRRNLAYVERAGFTIGWSKTLCEAPHAH